MKSGDAQEARAVFDDLVRFETVLWNEIDHRLQRDAGTSLAGLNALMVIDATPGCRVQDIARALSVTVGGTSQAVDRLEKAGWCSRAANPADRRSSLIQLTDAGIAVLRRALPVFDAALDALIMQPLSSGEFNHLAAAMHQLRAHAIPATRSDQ